MNYREAIQIQIKGMMDIYDNAESLRDAAGSEPEKEAFNIIRKVMPQLWAGLQEIDNNVIDSNGMAAQQLRGDYSIKVTTENI